MGGAHATSYPQITIANGEIDFLILSEAEFSFPAFLDEFFNKSNCPGTECAELPCRAGQEEKK